MRLLGEIAGVKVFESPLVPYGRAYLTSGGVAYVADKDDTSLFCFKVVELPDVVAFDFCLPLDERSFA